MRACTLSVWGTGIRRFPQKRINMRRAIKTRHKISPLRTPNDITRTKALSRTCSHRDSRVCLALYRIFRNHLSVMSTCLTVFCRDHDNLSCPCFCRVQMPFVTMRLPSRAHAHFLIIHRKGSLVRNDHVSVAMTHELLLYIACLPVTRLFHHLIACPRNHT